MKEYKIAKPVIALLIVLLIANISLIGYSKYLEHKKTVEIDHRIDEIFETIEGIEERQEKLNELLNIPEERQIGGGGE